MNRCDGEGKLSCFHPCSRERALEEIQIWRHNAYTKMRVCNCGICKSTGVVVEVVEVSGGQGGQESKGDRRDRRGQKLRTSSFCGKACERAHRPHLNLGLKEAGKQQIGYTDFRPSASLVGW